MIFLITFFFSLACFIVRIQYIIHILFMFITKAPGQQLLSSSWVWEESNVNWIFDYVVGQYPWPPLLSKGQLYIQIMYGVRIHIKAEQNFYIGISYYSCYFIIDSFFKKFASFLKEYFSYTFPNILQRLIFLSIFLHSSCFVRQCGFLLSCGTWVPDQSSPPLSNNSIQFSYLYELSHSL